MMNPLTQPQEIPLLLPLGTALLFATLLAWSGRLLLAGWSLPDALLSCLYYLELVL